MTCITSNVSSGADEEAVQVVHACLNVDYCELSRSTAAYSAWSQNMPLQASWSVYAANRVYKYSARDRWEAGARGFSREWPRVVVTMAKSPTDSYAHTLLPRQLGVRNDGRRRIHHRERMKNPPINHRDRWSESTTICTRNHRPSKTARPAPTAPRRLTDLYPSQNHRSMSILLSSVSRGGKE